MSNCDIAILLPSREGFDPRHFGAIALCVKDFVEYSRFRDSAAVFGAISESGFPGINYHQLPLQRLPFESRSKAYSRAFFREIQARKPRLVEIHNRPNMTLTIARQWQGPIALHLHNDPQEMKFARTTEQRATLLEKCVRIYCVSDYIKGRFLEGLSDSAGKVRTIYNGLAAPESLPEKSKQIAFVGRLKPEKGAKEFVEGLLPVLKKNPDWKGVIIGASRHRPDADVTDYEKHIHALLADCGGRIELSGFCDHETTLRMLAESEIAVIPSIWNEPFGRTALEAMACGCATVSSVRGGLREVVGDAVYPLQTVNGKAIAEALNRLIASAESRKKLQMQARQRARAFDIRQCTATLDDARRSAFTA